MMFRDKQIIVRMDARMCALEEAIERMESAIEEIRAEMMRRRGGRPRKNGPQEAHDGQ